MNSQKNISNKKVRVFIIFLSLSLLFWFLSKLSKKYTHTVKFRTTYVDIPNDKILLNEPKKNVVITIESYGFNFLSYKINRPLVKIDLSKVKKLKDNKYYYVTNRERQNLQSRINTQTKIIDIKPDTLFFDFGLLKSKKVKVTPNLKLNFKNGFSLTKALSVDPDSLTITGPEKIIDSIQEVVTKSKEINDVFKDFEDELSITTMDKVNYSATQVKVNGKVEKFTEGTLELDYKIINVADSIKVEAFTKKVSLTFKVSLKNFDKVLANDFEIVCDYEKSKRDSLAYLIPEVIKKSPLVSDLQLVPSKIEYLIKK